MWLKNDEIDILLIYKATLEISFALIKVHLNIPIIVSYAMMRRNSFTLTSSVKYLLIEKNQGSKVEQLIK